MQDERFWSRGILALAIFAAAGAAAYGDALVTFAGGTEGWEGPSGPGGATFLDTQNGNPAPSLRTQFVDFGITFRNNSNPEFIGDYTRAPQVALTVDAYTYAINFFGAPVTRDLILELRDYDNPPRGYPYVSVWYDLGDLDPSNPGWHTYSVLIGDTGSATLPGGWGGYGAEDPVTFEPILPPGRTFTNVLDNVDEIALTTFRPGFLYAGTQFDVAIDNVGIRFIPEPATAGLLALGLALLARRR